MKSLDFISKSPKLSIFREGSNKTTLGGVLYLIYIIILILLAVVYILNYFSQEKYIFNYTLVKHSLGNIMELGENEEKLAKFNANLDYQFFLGKDGTNIEKNNITSNKDFIIIDFGLLNEKLQRGEPRDEEDFIKLNSSTNQNDDECIIEQGKTLNKNTSTLALGVLYRCKEKDCTIREEDKILEESYYLYIYYKGFSIEHQNPDKPIQPLPDGIFWRENIQFLENTNIVYLNWEAIEYKEEKGIFGKTYNDIIGNKNTYYGGYYKSKSTYTDDGHLSALPDNFWKIKDLDGNHFKLLLCLESSPNYLDYERYSRKKISLLDALANVAALSSTVLNLMSLAYGILYSENYDNFKIIENILTKKMKINILSKDLVKVEDMKEEKMTELKTDLIITENEKNDFSINGSVEEKEEEENYSQKGFKENLELSLPKFLDFLIHKFYFKCCRHSRKQNLISSCHDIVAKYITIENILYNQMKLEYLWKDYKWNNQIYEKNQRDDFVLGLKEKL